VTVDLASTATATLLRRWQEWGTALLVKGALLFRPGTIVTGVPHHLEV
jgi:hypothetical protein